MLHINCIIIAIRLKYNEHFHICVKSMNEPTNGVVPACYTSMFYLQFPRIRASKRDLFAAVNLKVCFTGVGIGWVNIFCGNSSAFNENLSFNQLRKYFSLTPPPPLSHPATSTWTFASASPGRHMSSFFAAQQITCWTPIIKTNRFEEDLARESTSDKSQHSTPKVNKRLWAVQEPKLAKQSFKKSSSLSKTTSTVVFG